MKKTKLTLQEKKIEKGLLNGTYRPVSKKAFKSISTSISRNKAKKKIVYTDEPMEIGKVVEDLLPPPEMLIMKEDDVRVTINLSKKTIAYFKKSAKNQHVNYQAMIGKVLDKYVTQHAK
jgi:hypothetical protein